MSADSFNRAVVRLVLAKGHPASEPGEYHERWVYGSHHEYAEFITEHAKVCRFTADGPITVVDWSSFVDTFSDNKEEMGLDVITSCECGRWSGVHWLYEVNYSQALRELLAVEADDEGYRPPVHIWGEETL